MQKTLRFIWGLVLLFAIVWMISGAILTSGVIDSGSVGDEATLTIRSLASDLDIELAADFPILLVFVIERPATSHACALLCLAQSSRDKSRRARQPGTRPAAASQTVFITALALIFALLLWNDTFYAPAITYPVRLFVTFIHEAGHVLAVLLSGGTVHGFTVSPNGSGLATFSGGNKALIYPAGYLGASLFGAALFFATNRKTQWTRGLSVAIGIAIIALTLSFARPDDQQNLTAFVVGIGFGIGLIALGVFAPRVITVFLLNTLAILTGLNAVFDLWHVVRNPTPLQDGRGNDAAQFASATPLLSPVVVALIWAAIAVGMLSAAIYYGLIKQVEGEIDEVLQA